MSDECLCQTRHLFINNELLHLIYYIEELTAFMYYGNRKMLVSISHKFDDKEHPQIVARHCRNKIVFNSITFKLKTVSRFYFQYFQFISMHNSMSSANHNSPQLIHGFCIADIMVCL